MYTLYSLYGMPATHYLGKPRACVRKHGKQGSRAGVSAHAACPMVMSKDLRGKHLKSIKAQADLKTLSRAGRKHYFEVRGAVA